MSLDLRNTLVRDGVAAAELEGVVAADRFIPVSPRRAAAPTVALRASPSAHARQLDQLLWGERFDVLLDADGFALGQARRDGYVGWVAAGELGPEGEAPSHRVAALAAPVFAGPDLKSPLLHVLSEGALVAAGREEGRFVEVDGAGWAFSGHLAPVGEGFAHDLAEAAERYLHAPYLWGGRSHAGLDCSGLVMQAMFACGRACPRDSDQQQALGVPLAGRAALTRGDLVFWRGHVGVMLDGERLLHANAHHMAVAVEPLDEAAARIEAAGGGAPTGFRRP